MVIYANNGYICTKQWIYLHNKQPGVLLCNRWRWTTLGLAWLSEHITIFAASPRALCPHGEHSQPLVAGSSAMPLAAHLSVELLRQSSDDCGALLCRCCCCCGQLLLAGCGGQSASLCSCLGLIVMEGG